MKIVKLTTAEVKSVTCHAYSKYDDNGSIFRRYTIRHGTMGKGFGYWLLPVMGNISIPEANDSVIELNNDYYTLINRKISGASKDILGNDMYSLSRDFSTLHRKDLIVLWDIPNKNYTDVGYTINGDVELIGTGYNGKIRGEHTYKSPAPVLEVFGDCNMEWYATDKEGNKLTQKIAYDYASGQWDISTITKKLKE